MSRIFLFALLGLGGGALYGALAQGVILIYKSSRVINVAQGALALYPAYVFAELRATGRYPIPPLPNPLAPIEGVVNSWFGGDIDLPNWPAFVDLGEPADLVVALVVSVATAALLGLLTYLLVFRLLRFTPALARVVAAVGVMIVIQEIVLLRFGAGARSVESLLPRAPIQVAGQTVPRDRLWLAGAVVGCAVLLWLVFTKTRLGLRTRAAAESDKGATLIGIDSDRVALVNWVAAAVVAGSFGILFASITALTPTTFTFLVIPALAAALLARLESFAVAAAAGLGIGALQSLMLLAQTEYSWFPKTGAAEGIPFIVIIAALVWRARSLPGRDDDEPVGLPAAPPPTHTGRSVVVLAALAIVGLFALSFDFRASLTSTLTNVLVALSIVVVVGFVGQISLMQLGVAGLAGLAMTRLAGQWGVPFPLAPLAAAAFAAVVGTLVALPALRIRGVLLAVTTLGAGYTIEHMVLRNNDWLSPTNGTDLVGAPSLFGAQFGQSDPFWFGPRATPTPAFGLFLVALVASVCLVVIRLRLGRTGHAFLAVRSNERAAAGVGLNVGMVKMTAFAIAAFIAGLAGAVTAYRFERVSPESFAALLSLSALAVAYVGGLGRVSGALIAGVIGTGGLASYAIERFFHAGRYEIFLGGLGLVVMTVQHPDGLAGAGAQFRALGRSVVAVPTRLARARRPSPSNMPTPT